MMRAVKGGNEKMTQVYKVLLLFMLGVGWPVWAQTELPDAISYSCKEKLQAPTGSSSLHWSANYVCANRLGETTESLSNHGAKAVIDSSAAPIDLIASEQPPAAESAVASMQLASPEASTQANSAPARIAAATRPIPRMYLAVTGAMFAASVANAETLVHCVNCTFLPDSVHRRGVTYGLGLSLDAVVSYVSYKLAQKGHRWWYLPEAAVAVANGYLSYHWASSTN